MIDWSSCMLSDHCCLATIAHGRKNQQSNVTMGSFDGAETWIHWMLPFVSPHQEVWPKHQLILRRPIGSLQREATRNRKDQKRDMQSFPWQRVEDHSQSKHHQAQFLRCHAWPQKWEILPSHKRATSYYMSIKNPTTHHPSSRTFLNLLTKGSLKYHRIKNASIALKAFTRKHLTKVATAIISLSHWARHPASGIVDKKISCGLTRHLARVWQQTLENAFFYLSMNISLNLTPSIIFLTVTH